MSAERPSHPLFLFATTTYFKQMQMLTYMQLYECTHAYPTPNVYLFSINTVPLKFFYHPVHPQLATPLKTPTVIKCFIVLPSVFIHTLKMTCMSSGISTVADWQHVSKIFQSILDIEHCMNKWLTDFSQLPQNGHALFPIQPLPIKLPLGKTLFLEPAR